MEKASFEDHFSAVATDYARFRPRYPQALFQWLASMVPRQGTAWDCATGSGQAAVALAPHFERVVGTDASAAQVAEASASASARVEYKVCPAESTALESGSIDLVTVAQALHWFDHPRFFAEVRRVLSPGGVFAAWTYWLFRVDPAVDTVIDRWYHEVLDPYWPPERKLVEARYETIPFPFDLIPAPAFEMEAEWTLDDVIGYLGTWSAVKRFREANSTDPRNQIAGELALAWGEPRAFRRIAWEMPLLVGRP